MPRKRFGKRVGKASRPRKVAGIMNKTEAEHAANLDVLRAAGRIVCYWYEGMTFKLARDTRYTPDFIVLLPNGEIEIHEVKGGFIRDDARVKLKLAADQYPFRFIMVQKLAKKYGGGWNREVIDSDTWQEAA